MGFVLLELTAPIEPLPELESKASIGWGPVRFVLRSVTSFDKNGK